MPNFYIFQQPISFVPSPEVFAMFHVSNEGVVSSVTSSVPDDDALLAESEATSEQEYIDISDDEGEDYRIIQSETLQNSSKESLDLTTEEAEYYCFDISDDEGDGQLISTIENVKDQPNPIPDPDLSVANSSVLIKYIDISDDEEEDEAI